MFGWVAGGIGLLAAILLLIVPWVTRPAAVAANGESQTVMAGAMMAFLLVTGVLFAVNPDDLASFRPRMVEAAVLAAAGGVIWVPAYLVAVTSRLRRLRKGPKG